MGKLDKKELESLLKCIKEDSRVLVPPLSGYDSGVHFLGDKCVVVSTDPCCDVPKDWFGFLLVNYAASDVALFGAKPEYCTINLLGSAGTKSSLFNEAMSQICKAADDLNMVVVTGHTGVYESVNKLIGVCTAYGTVDKNKLILPSNIKKNDLIFQIKEISWEILSNFSIMRSMLSEKLFGFVKTQEMQKWGYKQSCVNEALSLSGLGGVNAMHDCTEGGLVSSLNELADVADLGFQIEENKILIKPEIKIFQDYFGLNKTELLSMSSTGTIIAAINPKDKNRIIEGMKKMGYNAEIIGQFTTKKDRIISKKNKGVPFPSKAMDPYNKILSE